jgi:thiol-disulfide isomerase/thioredoxin
MGADTPCMAALVLAALLSFGCDKPSPNAEAKPATSAAPEVSLPGLDSGVLTPRERREWSAQVSELLAPCRDVPVTIAQCVKEKRACKTCLPAAKLLMRHVQAGLAKKEREEIFHARFDANKVKNVPTEGSPEVGPPDAIVTIVEWADFECPYCKLVAPELEKMVQRFPGQVRLVYKVYPLQSHPHGEVAARAAIAALEQGKFWQMHHALFENQEKLEQSDIERYATAIGLDLPKFRTALTSKETTEKVEKDKKQAEDLGLDGTPFIFINGRKYIGNVFADLADWIRLDIELAGKVPKEVTPGGSAAPSAAPPAPGSSASAPSARAAGPAPPSSSAAVATPPEKK